MSEILNPLREKIVQIAEWGVANHDQFTYSEGSDRWGWASQPNGSLPWVGDCSAWATCCYKWAGAPDPSGLNFEGGYTGTLLGHDEHVAQLWNHNQHLDIADVQPADLVIYGPGTGWHVAIVIEVSQDSLTVSMGQQGDPSYVRTVSGDGREPQTFLRCLPPYVPAQVKPRPCPNKHFPPPAGHPPLVIYGHPASGAWVAYLQTLLRVPVTGKYDVRTLIALTAFQSDHGHPATGMVSPDTWAKLGVI